MSNWDFSECYSKLVESREGEKGPQISLEWIYMTRGELWWEQMSEL